MHCRNYIAALNHILHSNEQPSALEYAHMLSDGMSQTTTNLIATLLHVQPRLLVLAQQQRQRRGTHCHQAHCQRSYSNPPSSSFPAGPTDLEQRISPPELFHTSGYNFAENVPQPGDPNQYLQVQLATSNYHLPQNVAAPVIPPLSYRYHQ